MSLRTFSFIFILIGLISTVALMFTNCGEFEANQNASKISIDSNKFEDFENNPEHVLDEELKVIIEKNKLTRLSDPQLEDRDLVQLGKLLFSDPGMSNLRDVSCSTCHQNPLGSGDGLPLPIGSGGVGTFPNRKQINGQSKPMRRHSPAIFNKAREGMNHALWDGRLQFILGYPSSPVDEISGEKPDRPDITENFENAFDIQPLFPLITPEEFFGFNNDLSQLPNTPAIWDEILKTRVLIHEHYQIAFSKAYPKVELEKLNPGHFSRAIRAFLKLNFRANDTPFDSYLSGDFTALTLSQKRGMKVFYGAGKCNACHTGARLTNDGFFSVGVPHLGFEPFQDDHGREDATGDRKDRYKIKTPGLRNVKLSGPYMHNGAFKSLEQVIDHKNDIKANIQNYSIPDGYQDHYEVTLMVDRDPERNQERIDQVIPIMRNGLNLTQDQKSDLLEFLENGLLDTSFFFR